VHPSATWADVPLKRGQSVLESLDAARSRGLEVAVIPTADAPKPRRKARKPKAKRRTRR
jgi:hypothetical protein